MLLWCFFFFFQAEDGIRDLVRSRGLGDVYKRQQFIDAIEDSPLWADIFQGTIEDIFDIQQKVSSKICLLYTSDAADERSSVDLGGRRIIKKKNYLYTYALS